MKSGESEVRGNLRNPGINAMHPQQQGEPTQEQESGNSNEERQ